MKYRFSKWWKTEYSENKQKLFCDLWKLTPLILLLGIIYQIEFFRHFNVRYFFYFSISDPLVLLYEKGVLLVYALIVMIPFSGVIFLKSREKKESTTNRDIFISFLIISLLEGFFLIVFLNFTYKDISIFKTIAFILILLFANWSFAFSNKNITIISYIFLAFSIFYSLGNADAIKASKRKLRFSIISTDETYLKENDSCKYFISNTTNYIFIKNECNKRVDVYPTSEIKKISFKDND